MAIKTFLITILLSVSALALEAPNFKVVDINLENETPTCFQGTAEALEQGLRLLNREARTTCHDDMNGSLQFTTPKDIINIELIAGNPTCGLVKLSVNYKCVVQQ